MSIQSLTRNLTLHPSSSFSIKLKKLGRFAFSTASLVAGILVAVLIQAMVSSLFDNIH